MAALRHSTQTVSVFLRQLHAGRRLILALVRKLSLQSHTRYQEGASFIHGRALTRGLQLSQRLATSVGVAVFYSSTNVTKPGLPRCAANHIITSCTGWRRKRTVARATCWTKPRGTGSALRLHIMGKPHCFLGPRPAFLSDNIAGAGFSYSLTACPKHCCGNTQFCSQSRSRGHGGATSMIPRPDRRVGIQLRFNS